MSKLRDRLAEIHRLQQGGATSFSIAVLAYDNWGAQVDFRNGAYVFRLDGVTGTSTQGGAQAFDSWCRLAKRRLELQP